MPRSFLSPNGDAFRGLDVVDYDVYSLIIDVQSAFRNPNQPTAHLRLLTLIKGEKEEVTIELDLLNAGQLQAYWQHINKKSLSIDGSYPMTAFLFVVSKG